MMKKVDCHALQGKARNDKKRASFLTTPQDFKTTTKDSKICDEKSLLCKHSQGRALGVRNRRECEAIKDLSRKAESTSKAIGVSQ